MDVIDKIRNGLDLYFEESGTYTISKMNLDAIITTISMEHRNEKSKDLLKKVNKLKKYS